MPQMIAIPKTEKPARKPRSPKPQEKQAKPALKVVKGRPKDKEPSPTASRILRPSYRPGSFGDPL